MGNGGVPAAAGICLFIRGMAKNDDDLIHLSRAAYAIAFWIWFVAAALSHDQASAAIEGFFAILNTYLWWRNRKNRKRRRALQELGAKSRAIIAGMSAKLTPSPIPTPTGV